MTEDFETADPLSAYRGDLANYSVDGARAVSGSESLVNSGESSDTVVLNDGTDGTIETGNTYRFEFFAAGSPAFGKLYYFARGTDRSDVAGYGVEYDTGWTPELKLFRVDGGFETFKVVASTSIEMRTGSWRTIELTPRADGVHEARLLDGNGNTVASVSHDASNDRIQYTDGDFGFGTNGTSTVRWDDLRQIGGSSDGTTAFDYTTPAAGTTDWHEPLNENFVRIETDVQTQAERLGVSVQGGYNTPAAGTTGWHEPLNENFARIETDVQTLAGKLSSPPSVGGYTIPQQGATGWHEPLNENFTLIAKDMESIQAGDLPAPEPSTSGNYVYVTQEQLEGQKQLVDDGVQPFKNAFNNLLNQADAALSGKLRSVTDNDGRHAYYGREGHDRDALREMTDRARNCGLAYWFTGKDKYARMVIDIVHHWCLDGKTYMKPTTLDKNQPYGVNLFNRFPAMIYAASFVRGHPYWDTYDGSRPWDGGNSGDAESAFAHWLADRAKTYRKYTPDWAYNNQYMWMIADMAATAAYLEDDALMDEAKRVFKAEDSNWTTMSDGSTRLRPWNDFRNAGSNRGYFKHERNRNDGFGYTRYNMNAMACALAAFEAYDGTDLWGFNAPTDDNSGSTIRKTFNWFEKFVVDTSKWSYNSGGERITAGSVDEAAAIYELAHARFDDYDAAINRTDKAGGRPHDDGRHLGHQTLTHGAR